MASIGLLLYCTPTGGRNVHLGNAYGWPQSSPPISFCLCNFSWHTASCGAVALPNLIRNASRKWPHAATLGAHQSPALPHAPCSKTSNAQHDDMLVHGAGLPTNAQHGWRPKAANQTPPSFGLPAVSQTPRLHVLSVSSKARSSRHGVEMEKESVPLWPSEPRHYRQCQPHATHQRHSASRRSAVGAVARRGTLPGLAAAQ